MRTNPTEAWWTRQMDGAEAVPEMTWSDILEPGCYLMVASGLLARIHFGELGDIHRMDPSGEGPRVARLSRDPRASLHLLRSTALRHGYFIGF